MKTMACLLIAASAAAAPAWALPGQLTRQDLTGPGAMTSTCGGLATGDSIFPGNGIVFTAQNCSHDRSSSPSAVLGSSAAFVAPGANALTQAEGGMGWGRARSDFSGSNNAAFPGAFATVGWEDQVIISAPGVAAGTGGVLSFLVHVKGVLQALPILGNSGARITVRGYGNSGFIETQASWGGQGQLFFPYDEVVDTVVELSVDFAFDSPFELGVFARADARTASMGFGPIVPPFVGAFADLDSMHWGGISAVRTLPGGASQPGYSIVSASGIDWREAVLPPSAGPNGVPEPGTAALLAAAAVAALRRRGGYRNGTRSHLRRPSMAPARSEASNRALGWRTK